MFSPDAGALTLHWSEISAVARGGRTSILRPNSFLMAWLLILDIVCCFNDS
jgi:hypothetical protein